MNIFKTKEEFDTREGLLVCLILIAILSCAMIYHIKRLEKRILAKSEICKTVIFQCNTNGKYIKE